MTYLLCERRKQTNDLDIICNVGVWEWLRVIQSVVLEPPMKWKYIALCKNRVYSMSIKS